jgi:hypothetical protein
VSWPFDPRTAASVRGLPTLLDWAVLAALAAETELLAEEFDFLKRIFAEHYAAELRK